MTEGKSAFQALKKAIEHETERDYEFELTPRCPHCGGEYNIEANAAWYLYTDHGAETTVRCGTCSGEFVVVTNCTYSFSTIEQEGVEL